MKVVIVTGSHPRHLYVVNRIVDTGLVCGIILMKREKMVDDTPDILKGHIKDLYEHHFNLRLELENEYFGQNVEIKQKNNIPILEINRNELNDEKVEKFIYGIGADCLFSYGPDLFKDNILDCVNGFALNLHGGLSPWYKGAATMFWPFYFLEPNYVGTTLHYITKKIDAGNIVHQTVPKLEYGDCMHRVACKAVIKAAEEITDVLKLINKNGKPEGTRQRSTGKLFLEKDWRPEHLHLIYDFFNDKIVDKYLDGELKPRDLNGMIVYHTNLRV